MNSPTFLTSSLLVAIGGAIGSWLRFAVGRLLPMGNGAFPWATLTVNVNNIFDNNNNNYLAFIDIKW